VRAADRLADVIGGGLGRLAALVGLAAGASVLAQMNSTPCTWREIMCSTALLPPPPTPITLIWVPE
jgi:hypothetical protein